MAGVRIPIYQQQTNLQNGAPAPDVPMVAPANNVGTAIQGLGEAGAQLAGVIQYQENEDGKAWAAKNGGQFQLGQLQKYRQMQASAGPGAPDFTPTFLKSYDDDAAKLISTAPTAAAKKFMTAALDQQRVTLGRDAVNWQAQEHQANNIDQFQQGAKAATDLVFADPRQYQEQLAQQLALLNSANIEPDKRADLAAKTKSDLAAAAALATARSNPSTIVGAPGTGATAASPGTAPGGFSSADAWVASKEGGFVANDNGHGPTNFGINSQANPDIDVKSLTPEQASQVRKTRYWDAIHGDALPANLQSVAYNFAVQAGPAAANKLLTQADGDPAKFNDLAKGYYADIGKSNPAQAGNVAGWQQRSDAALAQGSSLQTPSSEPAFMSGLNFQQRLQVWSAAKTQQSQNMALGRAQLEGHVQDAQSQATQGVPDANPIPLSRFLAAYTPDEAARYYGAYQDSQQLARDVGLIKGMPGGDIANLVQSRLPLPGPGYAPAMHDHQILQAAAAHVMEQRNADPAQYVLANSTALQAAGKAFNANPNQQTAQAYATASIAEQNRLGIKQPQLLTKGQVAALEGQINDNGGASGYDVIKQQSDLWGQNWGTVAAQLKNVPSGAKTLGYLVNTVDEGTGRLIWEAARAKPEQLKDGLAETDTKAASTELQTQSQDFAKTMAYTPGGTATFSALYDTAERLAYAYMRRGLTATNAADQAYKVVMGNNFKVAGSARVPSQYDADTVSGNAQGMLDRLGDNDLALPQAPKGMTASAAKEQYVDSLKNNAMWITSSDGKGLVLFNPIRSVVVTNRDGSPVGATFDKLNTKSAQSYSMPSEDETRAAAFRGVF